MMLALSCFLYASYLFPSFAPVPCCDGECMLKFDVDSCIFMATSKVSSWLSIMGVMMLVVSNRSLGWRMHTSVNPSLPPSLFHFSW